MPGDEGPVLEVGRGLRVALLEATAPERFESLANGLAELAGAPHLVIAELAGARIALGRFQRASSALSRDAADRAGGIVRRASGGRTIAVGQGTIGVALAVPAGVTLMGGVPASKVLNRYVRGLLRGLGLAGATQGAHYFGRDFVSAERRQLAVVAQNGDAAGGVLLQAWVAVARTLALPEGASAYPEHSDSRAAGPEHVALSELWERPRRFDEIADQIALGMGAVLQLEREHIDAAALPERPVALALDDPADHVASGPFEVPIGFVEALVAVDAGVLRSVRIAGDFIAPVFMIEGFERRLVGVPATDAAVRREIAAVLALPHATLVGVIDAGVLADAVVRAATR